MTMHRVESSERPPDFLFRFKLFNGQEYHFLAPTMELAFLKFQSHSCYEPKVIAAVQIAKVDG